MSPTEGHPNVLSLHVPQPLPETVPPPPPEAPPRPDEMPPEIIEPPLPGEMPPIGEPDAPAPMPAHHA